MSNGIASGTHVQQCIQADPWVMLDAMPVGTFIVDAFASVAYANDRLCQMVGRSVDDIIGRSVLEFVDLRDVDFVVKSLKHGSDYDGVVMGPSRIHLVDSAGESHVTQFWSNRAPAALGVDGYIVTVTLESVRDMLAPAMSAVANKRPLDQVLASVARAGRALPLDGIGSVLVVEPNAPTDEERFRLVGDWPLDPGLVNAFGTPWRKCLVRNEPQDILADAVGDVDARTGAEMAMARLPAACVRPVRNASGEVAAVLVYWRRSGRVISVNQESHIDDAIRLAHVALEQDLHRRELDFTAHRDALTGVGNEAALSDRIELTTTPSSVLAIDLDNFKVVNDTFGHSIGDEVIAQAGRRIAEAVRRGDDVYRQGGDEFVVVCETDETDERGLIGLAERIVERLSAPFDCRDHRVRISATVGIASGRPTQEHVRSLQHAIVDANRALHVARDRGRGTVHHADIRL